MNRQRDIALGARHCLARGSQRGAALATGLILLLAMTITGVTVISQSVQDEKMTGNQKQSTDAFLAAEAGIRQAKIEWSGGTGALTNDEWGDWLTGSSPACDSYLTNGYDNDSNAWFASAFGDHGRFEVYVRACNATDGTTTLVSLGKNQTDTGTTRILTVTLAGPSGVRGGGLGGAINFNGPVGQFDAANSNSYKVDGNGGTAVGASTDNSREVIESDIDGKGRLDNYDGGIDTIDFPSPWNTPENLQSFVESIKATADYVGSDSSQINTSGAWSSQVITGDANVDFKGNTSGSGVLVVEGDLSFSGTPSWDGLIIVLGGDVSTNGGGSGGLDGSMFIANLNTPPDGDWSFNDGGSNFLVNGGGTADYVYDCDSLVQARNLLGDVAKSQWMMDDNCESGSGGSSTPESSDFYATDWNELDWEELMN